MRWFWDIFHGFIIPCLGLSGWVLNVITIVLIRERQREIWPEGKKVIPNARCYWQDFPGAPVVKMTHFQCWGCGFDSWLGNQDLTCCTERPKRKKKCYWFWKWRRGCKSSKARNVALESGKGKEMDSLLDPLEGVPWPHLNYGPVKLILIFWSQKL